MCKIKELIPRQQFDIAIQSAIGAKIISRETIKALRKDVTQSVMEVTLQEKKTIRKTKKRKEKNEASRKCRNSSKAFLAVLKLED